jgi:hypothetical protein
VRRLATRLAAGAHSAASALRGFLVGFTGMPAARLADRCPHGARRALSERADRRPSCC